jgi:hypothetical protein
MSSWSPIKLSGPGPITLRNDRAFVIRARSGRILADAGFVVTIVGSSVCQRHAYCGQAPCNAVQCDASGPARRYLWQSEDGSMRNICGANYAHRRVAASQRTDRFRCHNGHAMAGAAHASLTGSRPVQRLVWRSGAADRRRARRACKADPCSRADSPEVRSRHWPSQPL